MKVVILCGGLGTRLREETEARPKPMVPVGNRPILWHIMKIYSHYGYNDFVLCLGYRGNIIKEYFLNYRSMNNDFTVQLGRQHSIHYPDISEEEDFQITLAETGPRSMTGGRIKRIAKYIDEDSFMVTYGDGVTNVNIQALVDFHRSHGKLATITTVHPLFRFGAVTLETGNRVTSFREKPTLEDWVNAGFFVFNRAVFDYLDDDQSVLEQTALPRLAKEEQLMAFHHNGPLFAMDTYRDYLHMNELWEQGAAPWKIWK